MSPMHAHRRGARQLQPRLSLGERLSGWRRPLTGLAGLLVLAALAWAAGILYQKLDQPVAVIGIDGSIRQLSTLEIEELVTANIEGGFLGMKLQRIRSALEAHPWIESAGVRRQWPDRLNIRIVEETPIARWGDQGFLNRRGEALFADQVVGLEQLPLLVGPKGGAREVMRQYRDVNQLLLSAGLRISQFRAEERGDWSLQLDNGVVMKLGRQRSMEQLQRFLAVWNQALAERAGEVALVDIRYENGVAVQWRPTQEKAST